MWATINGATHAVTSGAKALTVKGVEERFIDGEDKIEKIELKKLWGAMLANSATSCVATGINESVPAAAMQLNAESRLGPVVSKSYNDAGSDATKVFVGFCDTVGDFAGKYIAYKYLLNEGDDKRKERKGKTSLEIGSWLTGCFLDVALSALQRNPKFVKFINDHNGQKTLAGLCTVLKYNGSTHKAISTMVTGMLYGEKLRTFKQKNGLWAGAGAEALNAAGKTVMSDLSKATIGRLKEMGNREPLAPEKKAKK